MSRIGTTTLPLAGWIADPQRPEESRSRRLHAIRQIVEHYGLQTVELTMDLHAIYPQVFNVGFYESVAELQQTLGFVCTAHLPFLWVEPASLNESIREASVASLQQAVEVARAVDVHTYVLHLWGLASRQVVSELADTLQQELVMGALMAQASRSLAELCTVIRPKDLCVENLEDSLFELALPVIEQHGASICLDVGHLALQGSSVLTFLEKHKERIREIHLHDAVAPTESERRPARDHLALGKGHVDYTALVDRLAELHYDGPVILEVNSQADLEQSLDRLSVSR